MLQDVINGHETTNPDGTKTAESSFMGTEVGATDVSVESGAAASAETMEKAVETVRKSGALCCLK